jgi:hypothetical protein
MFVGRPPRPAMGIALLLVILTLYLDMMQCIHTNEYMLEWARGKLLRLPLFTFQLKFFESICAYYKDLFSISSQRSILWRVFAPTPSFLLKLNYIENAFKSFACDNVHRTELFRIPNDGQSPQTQWFQTELSLHQIKLNSINEPTSTSKHFFLCFASCFDYRVEVSHDHTIHDISAVI